MKTVNLVSRSCCNIKLFGISWFRANVNRDGCLPKRVFYYSSNINAN